MAKLEKLQEWSIQRINAVPIVFRRYLWGKINWEDRLIIIVGARGVGKSTILLQYMKEKLPIGTGSLYASLENLYFTQNTLVDLAEAFVKRGGRHLSEQTYPFTPLLGTLGN